MDWQSLNSSEVQDIQSKLTKCQRFTLYDHNFSDPIINAQDQTFQLIFNCMKINKKTTSICKVNGNIKFGQITISCSFITNSIVLNGKWNFQKIQLIKFSFKYNQKSNKNMIMQVNPINGQICLTAHFMISPFLLKDHNYLRQIITIYSKNLGQQSLKIFNTVQQIIFCNPSNEPYLKSFRAGSSSFPPNIKMQKLLDKIKQLIATSSHYEIRDHINEPHLTRSWFKKKFKPSELQKLITKEQSLSLALVYEHKFHRKYIENEYNKKISLRFIKKYEQIEQKYEIEYTKYLKFSQLLNEQSIVYLKKIGDYKNLKGENMCHQYIKRQCQVFKQLYNGCQAFQRHPNIAKVYYFQQMRYYDQNLIPLRVYLNKNKKILSLSSKLQLMCQICHVMCYLHQKKIGFAIKMEDILIGPDATIQIINLYRYKCLKAQNNNELEQQNKQFPYFGVWKKQMTNIKNQNFDTSHEKCDVYNLAIILYIILMEKLPFYQNNPRMNSETQEEWENLWVVETQYYSMEGGKIVRLLGWLLLRCISLTEYTCRSYIQWLKVIIYQTKILLQSLL